MPYQANVSGTGSYFYPGVYYGRANVNRRSQTLSLSSAFTTGSIGSNPAIVLGPYEISEYTNYTVTMVNNHPTNYLLSGAVQVSPNGVNWGTINFAAFTNLTCSTGNNIASASFTNRCDRYVRAIAYPSGSDGAITGSIDCYITMN